MRLSLLSRRVPFLQPLIVALLIANLLVGGVQIALSGGFEGGDPPTNPVIQHLGCVDVTTGDVRVFMRQHLTFGSNPPVDACRHFEYAIAIFIAHSLTPEFPE